MYSEKIDLQKIGGFSALFTDYIAKKESLKQFYNQYPDLEGLKTIITQRKFSQKQRNILVESLRNQYQNIAQAPDFDPLLAENTFTVTTGHQLNIFTGPLYVIYKIVSTINLARQLKAAMPAYNFVPVYWMASEDHDFEEINNFSLFGKTYTWQSDQKGAVGRMQCTGIEHITENLPEKIALFEQAYATAPNLSAAVRSYMHQLFGSHGLVCIDADSPSLKAQFAPIAAQELSLQQAVNEVNTASESLEKLGYKTQVMAREINLFYLDKGLRERIVLENNQYKVLNTQLSFSQNEIDELLAKNPEKISPNVILRPVYQEVILPNVAYLGGPAEVVYWLQLKGVFDQLGVAFPAVMPRNFALYLNTASQKRLEKLGLQCTDLWLDDSALKQKYMDIHAEKQQDFEAEKTSLVAVFEQILQKSVTIDKTLEQAVLAEKQKTLNSLENLEKRIKKAEERLHETGIAQAIGLKTKLFPNGSPQERIDSYLNFALNNPQFIEQLLQNFDPLSYTFNLLFEE
jgi:bacillithiol synthase